MQQRNNTIDVMRGLGLLAIMLSYIALPYTLYELICADVPLMLFCSGLACSGKTIDHYGRYVLHRVLRLLVPAYIFGVFLYVVLYGTAFIRTGVLAIDWNDIVRSVCMKTGATLGYLWILKAFLLVMLVTPLMLRYQRLASRIVLLVPLVLVGFAVQSLLIKAAAPVTQPLLRDVITDHVLVLTGYSLVFFAGLGFSHHKVFSTGWLAVSFAALVLVLAAFVYRYGGLPHHFLSRQLKYPPSFWYLTYGLSASVLLWVFCNKFRGLTDRLRLTAWTGRNSLWLFLWHVACLYFAKNATGHWWLNGIILLLSTFCIFLVQQWLVSRCSSAFVKRFFG